MPYTKEERREKTRRNGLDELKSYLLGVPIELRKGDLAHAVMELAKNTFPSNYFGKSTGTDAVRSAFVELKKELEGYELTKKQENGSV